MLFSLRPSSATRVVHRTFSAKRHLGKLALTALAWCLLYLAPSPAAAQDVKNPQSAVDDRARSQAHVDPATLAMQLQIPLGAYSGRDGMSLPITLQYSSKLWRIKHHATLQCSGEPHSEYQAEFAKSSAAGWTSSLDWSGWPQDPSAETYDNTSGQPVPLGTSSTNLKQIARKFVAMPDGSRKEFRMDDAVHNFGTIPTGLYFAVDGSRMKYDSATDTLYLPDGSLYEPETDGSGNVTGRHYIDRNGNKIVYSNSSGHWTDTLGRTFGAPLSAMGVPTDVTYTVPGVNNTTLTYTLRWRYLKDPNTGASVLTDSSQSLYYMGDSGPGTCSHPAVSPSLFASSDSQNSLLQQQLFNPVVLSQIVLPNGQAYTFTYNVYGEIDKIVYPTGGAESFTYATVEPLDGLLDDGLYSQANRGVTQHVVYPDGTNASAQVWTYQNGLDTSVTPYRAFRQVTAPDGSYTTALYYSSRNANIKFGFDDARAGTPYDERSYTASGQLLRRRLTEMYVDGAQAGGYATATRNPRPTKTVDILLDTGGNALAATTTFEYDGDLNQTVVRHYDYAQVAQSTAQTGAISAMPSGALVRTDEATYLVNDTSIAQSTRDAYRARNLVALPSISRVHQGDVNGTVVSETHVRYDETGLQTYGGAQGWSDPGTSVRGLATTVSRWVDTTNSWIETHAAYDQFGNVVSATDARGLVSQVGYSASYSYAYPTSTTSAVPDPSGQRGSSSSLTTSTAYDALTGLVTSQTDANGQTTSYQYNDPLDRLKRVDRPDGGWTTYDYGTSTNAGQTSDYVRTVTALDGARSIESYQFFDMLGRPSRTFLNVGGSQPFTTTDTQYDALGRVWRVSNPYLTVDSNSAINPTGRWTTSGYDALGRVTSVTTPDAAVVTTSYSGNSVTVTDQAGKVRSSVSDALGRLTSVTEAPGVTNYGFVTNYSYDVLGNLRKVDQDGQQRFFMYDSLSRLIRAKNPEQAAGSIASNLTDPVTNNSQWSMAYGYDNDGNLTARVDARNITTIYAYDNLNRNTTVDYSNTTVNPDIDRHYDNPAQGKYGLGRYYYDFYNKDDGTIDHQATDAYDVMGRPLARRQVFYTNSQWYNYPVTRVYNLAGNVTQQTYPSGHTVTYNYDQAGRLADYNGQAAFSGNLGDGWGRTYAAGVSYDEASRMTREQFGTLTALYHKLRYTVRGQLWNVRLATTSDAEGWNRGMIVNHYSQAAWTQGWGASGADNNGNLLRSHYYIPNTDQPDVNNAATYALYYQDYEYDALNRLTKVTETSSANWQPQYVQAYAYDRWGNRQINSSQTWGTGINNKQFTVDTTTNRLYSSTGGMSYDNAGNLTQDTYSGQAAQRQYDGENRMTLEQSSATSVFSYYKYDADGHRARRNTYGQETWQVYGMDGELLAEYQAQAAPFIATKEYGYRGGELLVTAANGDDQRLSRFVDQLYNALGRGPSTSERQAAVASLTQAAAQGTSQFAQAGRDIAASLFNSTEYANRGRTDTQFVTDLYWTYCRRAPDAGGLQAWAAGVPSQGRTATRDGFAQNGEYSGIANRVFGLSGSEDERTTNFVNTLYYGSVERGPNSTEMASQVGRLNTASEQGRDQVVATARQIGIELFTSSEYANLNRSDRDFIRDLYLTFLNREPDQSGWDAWANSVPSQGRTAIVTGFISGGEFESIASALYRETVWLVSDHLGTPRMVVARTGALSGIKRHDYLPFGEELAANMGGRTSAQGYTSDNVRQKLTDKERDSETGLDYFNARYYSSTQGRFTSVDPENAGANPDDPQSWNGYAYARSSPVVYNDPDGRTYNLCTLGKQCTEYSDQEVNDWRKQEGGILKDGKIYLKDGTLIGTYERTWFDEQSDDFNHMVFGLQARGPAMKKIIGAFAVINLAPAIIVTAPGTLAGVGTGTLELTTEVAATEESLAGLSVQQLNSLIRGTQKQLLSRLFGSGVEGAQNALTGGEVPEGLTREGLLVYRELARRYIEAGRDATGVQALRVKIIDEALKKLGH